MWFQSKRKRYHFKYEYTGTTYENARKICQNKGEGWDLATFQTRPKYRYDEPRFRKKLFFETLCQDYDDSLKNIM